MPGYAPPTTSQTLAEVTVEQVPSPTMPGYSPRTTSQTLAEVTVEQVPNPTIPGYAPRTISQTLAEATVEQVPKPETSSTDMENADSDTTKSSEKWQGFGPGRLNEAIGEYNCEKKPLLPPHLRMLKPVKRSHSTRDAKPGLCIQGAVCQFVCFFFVLVLILYGVKHSFEHGISRGNAHNAASNIMAITAPSDIWSNSGSRLGRGKGLENNSPMKTRATNTAMTVTAASKLHVPQPTPNRQIPVK